MALINDRRAGSGLPVLWPNAALNTAAQGYAEVHFAAAPYALSHTLDGTPGDRAARAGYSGGVGECWSRPGLPRSSWWTSGYPVRRTSRLSWAIHTRI
jgi:hypothetical protein